MVKSLRTIAAMFAIIAGFSCANAQTDLAKKLQNEYVGELTVTVADVPNPTTQEKVEISSNSANTINFLLKNFILADAETEMPVGNICIENIPLTGTEEEIKFTIEQEINIAPGDPEIFPEEVWLGPILSPIPVSIEGTVKGNTITININIDLGEGMQVHVLFDNTALSVSSIATAQKSSAIYTLSGAKVSSLSRGINIVGGKKVLVK